MTRAKPIGRFAQRARTLARAQAAFSKDFEKHVGDDHPAFEFVVDVMTGIDQLANVLDAYKEGTKS